MINSIRNLGDLLLKNIADNNELSIDDPKTFLLGLVKRKPAGDNIARLLFSLRTRSVRLSRPEELEKVTDERLKEYLWLGNLKGNKRQNRLTTDRLEYLVSQTIPNILRDLGSWRNEDKSEELKEFESLLEEICKVFFMEKEGLISSTQFEYRNTKDLAEKMREKAGYSKRMIALYTISLETPKGETIDLACHRGYEEYLSESLLRERQAVDGRCHICGVKRRVLTDPAFIGGTPLKIYVVDKKGFTSGIRDSSEARLKAFAVCPQCLRSLLVGDAYIRSRMADRIRGLNVGIYLIPSLAGGVIGVEELEEWINYVLDEYRSVASFDGLSGFQRKMSRYLRFKGMEHQYMLHILFGTGVGSWFNLRCLIQDVPVSRFDELRKKAKGLGKQVASLFGDDLREWYLSFSKISEVFPLRRRRGELPEWRPLIELYNAILQGERYSYRLLVEKGLQLARIHRFGNYEAYTIREPKPGKRDEQFARGILGVTLLLKYLKDVGVLMEGPEFKGEFSDLPDYMREWTNLVGYDEEQQALFLLGVLIGKVGAAQFKKGDGKKSILDKVRFDGMDINRVMYLANRILEYLRIYRLLNYENEVVYGCMMKLFNRNLGKWSKGAIENVFYILSGYAFITLYAIKSSGGRSAK